MPIIPACHDFLTETAIGKWHETYRFKNKETDDYIHAIHRGMTLLRVETGTRRAFYWIYNIRDSKQFVEHVGLRLKSECHEVIITPRCRFFYDVDLALDEFQKHEFADHYGLDLTEDSECQVMDVIGNQLAHMFKLATLISLEEHGLEEKSDLANFDWMSTMRNRKLGDDGFKISIHLITNLMLPLQACSAIASHVKNHVIEDNFDILGIDESMIESLTDSIDETQYRTHGSLSLPFGMKRTALGEYVNWVHRDYAIHGQRWFITIEDQFSIFDLNLAEYNIRDKSNYEGANASPEFVKEALQHAGNIVDYSPRVWDLNTSILKRSTMYVKRYAPSMCSVCKRTHDNDNTLFLIFNSEAGIASWKCARMPAMKPIPFYQRESEATSDDDISAFASRHAGKQSRNKPKSMKKLIEEFIPLKIGMELDDSDDEGAVELKTISIKRVCASRRTSSNQSCPIDEGYEDIKLQKQDRPKISVVPTTARVSTSHTLDLCDGYTEAILPKPKACTVRLKQGNTSRTAAGNSPDEYSNDS